MTSTTESASSDRPSAKTQPTCETELRFLNQLPSSYFFSTLMSLKVILIVIFFDSETMYLQAIEAGQLLLVVRRRARRTCIAACEAVRRRAPSA